jgi:hypothetical protein
MEVCKRLLCLLTGAVPVDPARQTPAFATAHSFPVPISRQLTGQSSDLSEHLPELVGKSFSRSDDGFETIVPGNHLSRGSSSAAVTAAADAPGGAYTVQPLCADQQYSPFEGAANTGPFAPISSDDCEQSSLQQQHQELEQRSAQRGKGAEDAEVQQEGDMQYWLVPPAIQQHHSRKDVPHLEKLEEQEDEGEQEETHRQAGDAAAAACQQKAHQQGGEQETVPEAGYWGSPVKAVHKQWHEDIVYASSPKEVPGLQQQHLRQAIQEDSCGWGSFNESTGLNSGSISFGPRPRFSSFKEISDKISSMDGGVQQPAVWGFASQGGAAAAGGGEQMEPSLTIAAVLGADDLPADNGDAADGVGEMDFTISSAPDAGIRRVSSRGSRRSSRNIVDQVSMGCDT